MSEREANRARRRYAPYQVIVVCKVCGHAIGHDHLIREARVSIRSIVREHEVISQHHARVAAQSQAK